MLICCCGFCNCCYCVYYDDAVYIVVDVAVVMLLLVIGVVMTSNLYLDVVFVNVIDGTWCLLRWCCDVVVFLLVRGVDADLKYLL